MWWSLPVLLVAVIAVALRRTRWADFSLRISRWTYGLFIPLGLLYFPFRAGFRLSPINCEWKFDLALAVYSLTNFAHIILFAVFFLITYAQLPNVRRALVWSGAACFVMGLLVELAEGVTGVHHCRMRDLIPDMTGALAAALLVVIGRKASGSAPGETRSSPPARGSLTRGRTP